MLFSTFIVVIIILNFGGDKENLVNGVLIWTRIIPTFLLVPLVGLALSITRDNSKAIQLLLKFPFVVIMFFILVSTLSGFISNIQPVWSTWKAFEMISVIFYLTAIVIVTKRDSNMLLATFELINILFVILSFWVLYVEFVLKNSSVVNFIFNRLNLEIPRLNAINISAFSTFGLLFNMIRFGNRSWLRVIFVAINLVLFIGAKSRTGLLICTMFFLFYLISTAIGIKYKVVAIMAILIGLSFVNETVKEVLRISDSRELATLGGRVTSTVSRDAAWPETVRFISESPVFGYGFINAERFMRDKKYAVDNFYLQSILSAGIVGSLLYMLIVPYYLFLWLKKTGISNYSKSCMALYQTSFLAFSIGFARAISTNDLAFHGLGFLMFGLSIVFLKSWKLIC